MQLIVRDTFALLENKVADAVTMPSGSLSIVADDGTALFIIELLPGIDGIRLSVNDLATHHGTKLDDVLLIQPRSPNMLVISRRPYLTKQS